MEKEAEVESKLTNENPAFLVNAFTAVTDTLAHYGWYLLFVAVCCLYAYYKAQPNLKKLREKKDEEEYAAKYHKDSDLYQSRQEAMQRAREKLQEKHRHAEEEFKVKDELRKERKRQEWVERQCNSKTIGQTLGSSNSSNPGTSKSLRPEYNPLMGSGGGRYKAPKKSGCPGGGCGK